MKLVLTLTFYFTFFSLLAQEKIDINNIPHIEVTGEAELDVEPNEIYLTIFINEGDKGNATLEKIEKNMINSLDKMGIDTKEQLKVLSFASDFKPKIIGQKINTSKRYELVLNKSKNVSLVFVELEKLGISNINLTKVDHSDIKKLEVDVKVMAVRSAKDKANRLLEELGDKVGKTLYIRENNNSYYPMRNESVQVRSFAAKAESAPANLEFQSIKLKSTVQVRFSIE